MMGRQTAAADVSDSQLGPVSTFSVQAGKAKIVLSVLKNHASIRVRIRSVTPDLTEVGGTLEEAKALRQEHDELTLKLGEKQAEIVSLLVKLEGRDADDATKQRIEQLVKDAWKDISTQLEQRKMLLDQSVAFHTSALQFGKKMSQVEARCAEVPQAQDVETARKLIQQHQELKKSVLEASMTTLQEGQLLLDRIRRMALCADVQNRHATTSGCFYIEQLLLNLQDRKRRLEELWLQRKIQLEQCIQLLLLDHDAGKVTKWLDEVGEVYLAKKDLGDSLDSANSLFNDCLTIDQQFLAAPQTVRRLIGAVDYLTHPVTADKDAVRQRFVALDQRCDNFVSRLNVRRKNVSLSAYFFALAQEALLRLEEIEVLVTGSDLASDSPALAERHAKLLQSILEASIAALHVGRTLLGRVGKDDAAGNGISAKVTELQERCTKLQGLCTARPAPEKQPSEAFTQLLDKFNKLNAWVKYVGQASVDRYSDLGIGISDANDFLITHRGLAEDFKTKLTEAKSVVTSAEDLAKADNKDASELLDKAKKLAEELEKLVALAEKRSKIALSYVVLNKREQQLSVQLRLLEEHLKQEKMDPSLIPESAIRQREDAFKKVTSDCAEIDRIGKQFLNDINELKTTDQLNTEFVVRAVSLLLSNFADRKEITGEYFEHWKAYAIEGRTFSTQWKQFIQDARKTIDWVMKVEDTFFPKIAGELGSSLNEVQQHQRKLDDFRPTIIKAQEETEKHLKTAELLSLRGDTRGQRDQIVNELLKVHTRFQARIGEYRYLLNMATKFFENLTELDKLIETTEKAYASEELPKDVSVAEATLRQHNADRTKLKQLIEFSSEEADQIIIRVRQQDSEEVAKDEVQKVLQLSEEKRNLWEKAWDDHKRRLEQCLQVSQFYFDLKQLQDELDELQRQLDTRQGSYGNSLSSVKMIVQAFVQLEKLADLIGERFKDFVGTADKMINDRHYDSRRIRHEVDETEKRWNTVYNTIKSYRIALEASTKFFDGMGECEGWINDAGQFLHGISRQAPQCKSSADVDRLITLIQKYKQEGAMQQDGRLNNMERIATDLYGSVLGPEKMQHILDKNQEMFNAFIKAIEDLNILRNNLINTEQILANVGAVVEKKAPRQPRFVQPLQNAEITEGQRFTFECRLECDTLNPVIQWLKDNEPVKGFVPSYKDGMCSLTIEETMLRDSGSFVCQAKTEAGSTETSATLRVKELLQKVVGPEFSKQLKPLEVPEGTSCLLECYVSGIPFPTITWFRDDVPIANSPEHVITIDGGCCFLKIRKLNKDHTGLYKCKASNPGGDAITSASVNVISVKKPEFTQPLKDAKVDEGKSIRLECRYTGDPAPQIQWLFNDSPILPSALFKIIVEENFTALEIHEVFPEDCGNYTATAKNLGGEARTNCLLSLVGVLPTAPSDGAGKRPEFVQRLQRCDVLEGNRAKLECIVTGVPEPEVLWYHNDKPIKKSKDFDISYHNGRCLLAINEVYLEDSGEYLCTARNVHGMARTECRLVVEPLSEFSDAGASLTGEVPPKFTQLLKDIEGVEGELVRFECRVIGFPEPVIKWYCGRNQLSTSPEFEITSEKELQMLTIPTAHKEDAGNYMVKATNNAGIAKCYATLIVKPGGEHAMKMRLIESSHSVQTSVIEGHKPPEVVKSFHDLHVRPGRPCTMEVVIVGKPRPKIQWLFNNEPIVSPDYKISALGDVHSLHIPEVFDEDAGRFSVIAENDAGKAWCSALLVVVDMSQLVPGEGSPPDTPQVLVGNLGYGPPPVVPKIAPQKVSQQFQPVMLTAEIPVGPEFPEPLRNVAVEEGARATFEISIAGRPEPMIRWFKDGRQLIGGTGGLEVSFRDGRARLTLPSALERDAGRYTCTASNVAGEASSTAELIVKASATKPRFTQTLETQNVREGESVRFQVRVSGKPLPEVTWYREGMPIVNSPDFNITQDGDLHTLYIPEVFPEDSGRFSVKVISTAGQAESSADLIVKGSKSPATFTTERSFDLESRAAKFLKGLSNRTAQVGQRITLECAIPPHPAPERVQWFHNEVELFISPQHQISYSNGNCLLSISRVVPESRGKYACTVLVNGLPTTTDMHLDVVGEPIYDEREAQIPQFRDRLKHVKYEEGQDVVFVCQVAAHPPPNIQWFHSGRLIRPSSKYEMKLTRDGVCSLRIRSVGPQDVGIYTCSATNVVGQEYSSAELYVPDAAVVDETSYVSAEALRRMMHSPGRGLRDRDAGGGVSEQFFKPVFRKVPTDLEVPEGNMARFDSIVAGRPIPDMLWYRDGTQVFDDRLHKIVINEEGINSLIIDATSVSDAGLYTCIARNRAGEDQFQVRLNILPRQAAAPPRFQARLANQQVNEGQSVTFSVEVEGFPPPTLSWQKDGYHITSSDRYQIHTEGYRSTLYIPVVSVEDSAWFQCTAAGPGGTATNRIKLIVLPSEPQESQRTYVQSMSPALRKIPTPVGRRAPSPDSRQINLVIAPSPRASPWQQQQQYAEEIMSRTAVELQTKRTEFPMSSEAAPQLIEPMKDQQVVEGVTSQFRCKIYSATEPRYEWFFNNRPIHQSHKYHIEANNGFYALTITGITVNDAGVYKCVVSNQGGEVTCIAHLRVGSQLSRLTPAEHVAAGPQVPHFAKALSDVSATIGSSANFEVNVGSQPVVEVQWFLNGYPIQPSENFQVLRSNGTHTLRIKQVTADAIGTYTCRLISPLGSVESSARLTVRDARQRGEPPHFTRLLQDVSARDGSEVSLRCTVTGQPTPEVSWYHNDKNIDKSTDFVITYDDRTGVAELVIVDCMQDDQGHFKCVAKNQVGQAETGCRLTLTKAPAAPDVTDSRAFPAEVKEQVVVPAIVEGKRVTPVPAVPTLDSPKEGDILVESSFQSLKAGPTAVVSLPQVVEDVVRPVVAEPKTITVPDLSNIGQKQAGTVVTVGPGESRTIVIPGQQVTHVHGVTTVVEVSQGDAPRFTQPIQPCVVVEGQSCTFRAVVVGDPWPEITWLKEKEDLVLTERHRTAADVKTGSCSLTIVNCQPPDTGVYSCRATNAAGRATCTANVVVVPPNVEVTVTEKTMSVKKEKVTTMGDQEIRVVESSPTFKEALPPLLEVNEGEPVRLQCQVSAEPEPNVSWFFNGNRVTSTHRVTLTYDKTVTVLAIPSTTLADTGEYICTARNPLGEAHTKTFLRIKKLEKEPVPVVPAQQPSSKPVSEVLVQPISSGSAVEVSLPMPPMALMEPCSVIPLTSPKPESPKFLVPLRNQTVKEGDGLRFNVHYRGNPAPRITWQINGKPVQEDGDFQVTVDADRGESTLTIREVFPDDEGEYTCRAVNTVGTAISNSHLFVVVSTSSDEERTSTEKTTIEEETTINRELWKNMRNEQETIIIDRKPRTQVVEVLLGSKSSYQSTLETNIHRDEDALQKNHFIPIPVIEQREMERSVFVERSTNEQHQVTEVIGAGGDKIFSETVAIDRTDQRPETIEFQLAPEKKTKTSELRVHRNALPKGMKMEQLLLLERNIRKHEISESLLAPQVFSETVAIDTSDHKPQTLEIELKQLRSSELLVHQKALPKGVKMEAEILESLKKTSRLDLARSKYIEAIENQRQEILLNLEGAAPRFVKEIQSQKVMDGGKVMFSAKVIGNPMPDEVTWYHDDKIIANNPDFHTEYDKRTGEVSLYIGELFPQDAGLYECLATNVYGQAVTDGNLIVEAYEYVPDSEESWTSQGESSTVSTSSAMETLQKLRIESKELVTQVKQDIQIEKISERREEEYIHIADVKWCKPKYVEPVVEIVTHENVTTLSVESKAITAPQTAIPQVTTQVSVRASDISRVHPLQEVTKTEEVHEFDETDSGSRLRETQQVLSPLASPAVGKMTEARVSMLLERLPEERVTHLDVGMASPEVPVSLAISGLELVKVAKTVGTTFIKTDQLPAQPLEAAHALGEVSLESGRTEVIQVEMGTSRARDIPSSWVVPLVAQENAENVQHLGNQLPSPQKTEEKEIIGVLIKPTASKAQTLVSTVVEYHSEGEEEELFHEAAEPSICGRAVVQENLVHISVRPRPYSLAQPLEEQLKVEAAEAELRELVKENPRREEITVSLESAFRSLPIPSQTRPQEEFINVTILREDENSLREIPKVFSVPQVIAVDYANPTREDKPVNQVFFIEERASPERISADSTLVATSAMISVPQLIASEFESTKKEEKPVSRATVIEDRLSPEKTILVRASNYDEISMILPAPQVIHTELGSTLLEGKPVTRVQTIEDRLNLESALDTNIARVEDMSFVLPNPEVIHLELVKSSADDKPVMRTMTVEDRISPDRIAISQTVNLDELSLILPAGELVSVELVSSTREGKPVTRAQTIEDHTSVLNVDELNKEPVSKEVCRESLETYVLDKAEVAGARPSLVQVIEEQMNLLRAGELHLEITTESSKTEFIESQLTRSSVQPKPYNQVLISRESLAQENVQDEGESNLREISMMVSLPELISTEFVCSRKEDKPVSRTLVVEDRLSPEKTIIVKSVNLDEISMILPSPELIKTELGSSLVENKPVTRVQTTEELLSLEAMSEHVPTRADDLAMTLPAPQLISSVLATSTAEGKPVTRALQIEDRLSPDRVTLSHTINLNDLALTLPGGHVASAQLATSLKEDKPVSRTLMVEDLNLPEDVSEAGKSSLASLLMMLSAAEVESAGLVPASKEEKPVTQAVIQEEHPQVEKVSERAALRVDEIAVTMPAPKLVSVELESSVSKDKTVSKVVPAEDRVSPERIVEGLWKGTDDIAFTVSAQLEPSVDFETKVNDYIPVSLTQTREDLTALERVAERSVTIDELLVTAFTSLMSGAELASAIRDFLISQVQISEEQRSSETVSEKGSSVSELLVSALSSQITAADLAFAVGEKLILHVRTIEERLSPERALEKTSNTSELCVNAPTSQISPAELAEARREKLISQTRLIEERMSPDRVYERNSKTSDLVVSALSSQISAADLAFAMRDKLISQVRFIEERLSPERVLEKTSSTSELLVNALSSQMSAADLALAMRDKLISQVRFIEERLSPERVLEKSSSTNELLVNALSSQISAADLAFAMRDKLISQVRFIEERLSPERVLEKSFSTNELLVNALSSQISAADLAFAMREKLISQVRFIQERISPERVLEKSSSTNELITNAFSSQISASDLTVAKREKLISQVGFFEERTSPERVLERTSSTSELLVSALSSQISAADLAFAVREKLISQAASIEERMSPERILEKTSSTSELLVNALSSQISAAELAFAVREMLISQARLVEERNSPDRVSDKSCDTNELLVSALSSHMPYTEMTQAMRDKVLTMVQPVEERKSPEKVLDRTDFSLAGQTMTLPSAEQVRSVLTWGMTTGKAPTMVRTIEERMSPDRISEGIRDAASEESGKFSEIQTSSEHSSTIRKHRSQTLVLPQVVRFHVEAAAKLDSVPDEFPVTSETRLSLDTASVSQCAIYMNEETREDKEIVTEITVVEMVTKEREPVREEIGEETVKKQTAGPTTQRKIMETEIETEIVVEEWEEIREGREKSVGSESETHSINEEWEETIIAETTTQKDITVAQEPEDMSEFMQEEWEEKLTTQTTTEREIEVKKPEPEDLSESEFMHEEWEEKLTTQTTTEKEIEVKREPEVLSESEFMQEEWEETVTTSTTTERDIEVKQPEKEDLTESQFMEEEWEEVVKTTTITEQDLLVKKEEPEPEKESDSETQSLLEEWEETRKTETTIEKDVTIERQVSKESLSETESMHEEWAETKKTITIVEKDILLGEMQRVVVDKKAMLVCKEMRQAKEVDGSTQLERVEVTDSSLEQPMKREQMTRERTIETETTYGEVITKDSTDYQSTVQLTVPSVAQSLQPITVIDGSKATLTCRVSGYPEPEVKWYVDGMEIKQSTDFKMTFENGICTLVIDGVLPEDEGEYCLRAANAFGSCKSSAYMTVKHSAGAETTARQKGKGGVARNSSGEEVYSSGEEASSGWTVEESKVFKEFKNLEIDVSLKRKGVVDSKFQWLQEQSARQSALQGRTDLEGEAGFFDTRKDISDGQTDFKQAIVASHAGQAPVFVSQLESRDVFESTPVKLECDVKGFPQPEITWFQDGKKIHPDDHMKLSYNHGRCTLFIDRVTIDDEAEYVCEARNEHGVATSWAELLVEKLIEGLEQLVMEEFYELEIEMQFKWRTRTEENEELEA